MPIKIATANQIGALKMFSIVFETGLNKNYLNTLFGAEFLIEW